MPIPVGLASLLGVLLLVACSPMSQTAGSGSSVPDAAAQNCEEMGLLPGTAAFQRCVAGQQARENAATRGVVGTLFRNATMGPLQ